MRNTVTILFLSIVLLFGVTEVKANVYASAVEVDFSGTFPATISYNLNQDATSVVIRILDYPAGNIVKTITIAGGAAGTLVGSNEVEWDGSLDAGGTASSGVFTIEIRAEDTAGGSSFELLSYDTGPDSWYWSSSGVVSNNRQLSPYFGRYYVTERTGGTSGNPGGIETIRGLYMHDSFGRYLGFSQSTAYATGNSAVDWDALAGYEGSPWGATVGPDDRVYLFVLASNGADPKDGGLAVGDGDWSTSSVETILSHTDLSNHNPISDALVVGLGADRMLYTVEQTSAKTGSDNDKADDGDGFDAAEIKSYALGTSTGLFTGSGTVVIPTSTLSHPFRIEMDSDGYLYVVQQAYDSLASADSIYGLSKWDISGTPTEMWHVNLDAAPDRDSTHNANGTQATNFNGLALDEAQGRIYVTRKNAARPLHNVLSYDMATGDFVKSFASAQSIVGTDTTDLPGGGGSSIRDVNVDAAGNVLIVNSSFEAFRIYSPGFGPNGFTTYSPWAVDVDNSSVIATPLDFTTGIDDRVNTVPKAMSLEQNYPNPFNGTTVIDYSLSVDGEVKLVIYDILGREIATLVSTNQNAGSHSVKWLGQNNQGIDVVSGIYFYKLTFGTQTSANSQSSIIKRMVYLR